LVSSVLVVDRSPCRAPLTGVFGGDEQHRDAGTSGLVGDECLQRPERPVTKPSALGRAGLDPFANALEVVPLEPPLFSRERAKLTFGGLGAAMLQSGSAPRHSLAYLLARVVPAITIGRQVDDTKVDAKDLGRLDLVRADDVADAGERPLTADQHQVEFALAVGEQIARALAHHRLDLEAPFEGADRPDVVGLEADNSEVFYDRRFTALATPT
jgi:hypothetical protein